MLYVSNLYVVFKTVKFIETESRMVVAGTREGENEELLFNGYRVSLLQDEKVLEVGNDDSCTSMQST